MKDFSKRIKKKNRESGSPLIMMEGFIILPKRRARFFSFSFFKYTTRESEVTHSFSFLHPFFLFIFSFPIPKLLTNYGLCPKERFGEEERISNGLIQKKKKGVVGYDFE